MVLYQKGHYGIKQNTAIPAQIYVAISLYQENIPLQATVF